MKTLIIAEAGVNHNGDIGLAKDLIAAAAEAGADWVKFQSFKAANLVTKIAPKAEYQRDSADSCNSQFEMLKKLELSKADHEVLIDE
jgi:sialic acid synthase SpsE